MNSLFVNARFLCQPYTGVQQYAANLSVYLKQHHPEVRFVCPAGIVHNELARSLDAEIIGTKTGTRWEQSDLPGYLKKQGNPLLLNLGNSAPLRYPNQFITLHDIAVYRFPRSFSFTFRTWYRYMVPRIVRNSRGILTVSEFSRQEIITLFPHAKEKTEIVYNSLPEIPASLPEKGNYLLSVNTASKRKGIGTLLEAYRQIPTDLPLFLRTHQSGIYRGAGTVKDDKRVTMFEHWDPKTYHKIVSEAITLINPSLYEGFGMPNLEAMAWGTPVIVSDIAPFREVCGDAALYFKAGDAKDLAEKLAKLLYDQGLQEKLTITGRERAERFLLDIQGKHLLSYLKFHH